MTREGSQQLGVLAHELRNRLASAFLAYEILQDGKVAINGSTGAVLGRNLRGMRDLINTSLASVRVDAGIALKRRVAVAEIIDDAEVEARMGAKVAGIRLIVSRVPAGIDVEVDPQLLSAAIGNLLQNAFKFGRREGAVVLRTTATAEKVQIEIEDECGGLPPGKAEGLFCRSSSAARRGRGLGLGLSISRKSVEAMGGSLSVRDLPRQGCVFCIELPRLPAA